MVGAEVESVLRLSAPVNHVSLVGESLLRWSKQRQGEEVENRSCTVCVNLTVMIYSEKSKMWSGRWDG